MRTIIHNIEIVKTGLGMSGGENSLLSLVTIWNKTKQVKNIIYTSENGIVVYKPFLKNKKKH